MLLWLLRTLRSAAELIPHERPRGQALSILRRAEDVLLTEGPLFLASRSLRVWRWIPGMIRSVRRDRQYDKWLKLHSPSKEELQTMRSLIEKFDLLPKISIIMPVYNTDSRLLRAAIESVLSQAYPYWELCIADDASTRRETLDTLAAYEEAEERIRVSRTDENSGIASTSNRALELSTGEFVAFLDHDDELKPNALFEVAKLVNHHPDADLIYSDEDKQDQNGRLCQPFFKPDWSPDLLLSTNYANHLTVMRKDLVDKVGGLRPGYDGSQDYDLWLRVTEVTKNIHHIPLPLYTWYMGEGSAAASTLAKPYAYEAAKRALFDALSRREIDASVEETHAKGFYRIRYRIKGTPSVAVVIPTRDGMPLLARCIERLQATAGYPHLEIIVVDNGSQDQQTLDFLSSGDFKVLSYPHPFNFSAILNHASRTTNSEHLLFLNDDTEPISNDWVEAMMEHSQRSEVGAVGARLLYPNGIPQHEGIVIGLGGPAANLDHRGYFNLGGIVRNFSAVTAACLMTRASVFQELGGFDERLAVDYNDVDYCLRARGRGYLVVYTPYAELIHHHSATRGSLSPEEDHALFCSRWRVDGFRDPYYNPNLSLKAPFDIALSPDDRAPPVKLQAK